MAVFNPNPQQVQEEDFRNYSHPISPVEGNKALGTALSGVGTGLAHAGEFVKDIGKVQEFNTRQAVENNPVGLPAANIAREQSIAAYENVYNQTVDAKELQTSLNAPNAGLELIAPGVDKDKLPLDVRNAEQIANTQGQAKLDTKINQVLLTAQVDTTKKRLRALYPDHADYIDHIYRQAGFGDTANRRYEALQQWYLAANAKTDDETKASLAMGRSLLEKGVPGEFIAPLMEDVRQHKPGAIQRMDTIGNSYISEDYLLKKRMQQLADQNTLDKDSAAKTFGTYLDGVVNSGLQSMYTSSGYKNFDEIQARVQWIQAHPEATNPLEVDKLSQQLHLLYDQHESLMNRKLFEPISKGSGTTNATLLGPDGAQTGQAMIKARLYPIAQTIQAVENKDFGLASHIPHMIDAMTQADMKAMMDDKELGPHLTALKAAIALSPTLGEKIYFQTHEGIDAAMLAFVKNRQVGMVAHGTSLIDGLQELIKSGRTSLAAKPLLDVASWVHDGTLTNDDQKRTVAKSFFDYSNQGVLKLFSQDRYEQQGKNRVFIPGREFMFKDLTSPKMADEMKRLGPQTWNMYKTYVDKEHGESIFLGQLRQLEQFSSGRNFKGLDVAWDDKDGHFHAKGNTPFSPGVPPAVQRTIDQVNEGLDSYNYIAEKDGQSKTVYTLKKLRELHIDLGGFTGIPAEMLKAVQGSTVSGFKMLPGETKAQARERIQKKETEGGDNNK
jgi:hypothetical protein